MFRVPVFCCMWVDNNNGFRVYELGSMQVDLNRPGYKDGPFILASQTRQVFYVSNPANKKWYIVLLTNKIIINNNIDDQEDIDAEDDHFFGISLSHEITTNDDLYTRDVRSTHDSVFAVITSGILQRL
ncbi:hypothetical protein Lal_00020694 [Lupinus albus]|nr:hypothetical protein Lal_00020694 [Lupinus albus]